MTWVLNSTPPYHRPSFQIKPHPAALFCYISVGYQEKVCNARCVTHFSIRAFGLCLSNNYIVNVSICWKTILLNSLFFTVNLDYRANVLERDASYWKQMALEFCASTYLTLMLFQGNKYFKQGKYDEAIECYTRGMDADPYNPVLPTNRASAYFRLKK